MNSLEEIKKIFQLETIAVVGMSPKPARAPVLAPAAGAVSCVGNMRPAPEWESGSFFGVHSRGYLT